MRTPERRGFRSFAQVLPALYSEEDSFSQALPESLAIQRSYKRCYVEHVHDNNVFTCCDKPAGTLALDLIPTLVLVLCVVEQGAA
eukprot:1185182-Prorocentrum_minimum.AAC.2